MEKIETDFYNNNQLLTKEECIENYQFSIFENPDELHEEIERKIFSLQEIIKKEEESRTSSSRLGFATISNKPIAIPRINYSSEQLIEERDLIEALIIKIEKHCDHISIFLAENSENPQSSSLVNFSLCMVIALFAVGVIYPLSFMPLTADHEIQLSFLAFFDTLFSIRGAILVSVSLIFGAIVIIFFIINIKLKYPDEEMAGIFEFSTPSSYSSYLKNREININKGERLE